MQNLIESNTKLKEGNKYLVSIVASFENDDPIGLPVEGELMDSRLTLVQGHEVYAFIIDSDLYYVKPEHVWMPLDDCELFGLCWDRVSAAVKGGDVRVKDLLMELERRAA